MNMNTPRIESQIKQLLEKPSISSPLDEDSFLHTLCLLHEHYCNSSLVYKRITSYLFPEPFKSLNQFPFLPVGLFKELDLGWPAEGFATYASSGTSGRPSKIFLDKHTQMVQRKAFSLIVGEVLGSRRIPTLFLQASDKKNVLDASRAARVAFSTFGKPLFNIRLDEGLSDLEVWVEAVGDRGLIFGFTGELFAFLSQAEERNLSFPLLTGKVSIMHGGGWKRLESIKVPKDEFYSRIRTVFPDAKIFDYYGMIEQTGSVYLECEKGLFHASRLSAVLIRDPLSFEVLPDGQDGLIQTFSLLPTSYPGASLLTEDIGQIVTRRCSCGHSAPGFIVLGRLPKSDIRGCSNTSSLQV